MKRIEEIGFGNMKLIQDSEEFRYGIDAVLLADFAAGCGGRLDTVIDLGTGSGIVPLILSHKLSASYGNAPLIAGVDFNEKMIDMARESCRMNGLEEKVFFIHHDVAELAERGRSSLQLPERFEGRLERNGGADAVVMNPPYVAKGSGLPAGGEGRFAARHETSAGLKDFVRAAGRLLRESGHLFMVHRPARLVDIIYWCREYRLEPKQIRFVLPSEGAAPNILLLHCVLGGGRELKFMPDLVVREADGSYSEEIERIYERVR